MVPRCARCAALCTLCRLGDCGFTKVLEHTHHSVASYTPGTFNYVRGGFVLVILVK